MSNHIDISLADQELILVDQGREVVRFSVSTAAKGAGEQMGSECTPRGHHIIRAKIGAGQPLHSVFVGRRPTGEIYTAELANQYPQRDWILTRILWLSGCQPGINRLGSVDTMRRYIYIHGCPEELPMGQTGSHGCIRMHNEEVVTLFDLVAPGMAVYIHD